MLATQNSLNTTKITIEQSHRKDRETIRSIYHNSRDEEKNTYNTIDSIR